MKMMEPLMQKIFAVNQGIRYVAIYENDQLISSQRPGIDNSSSSESDKYEELIVNPTLLKLVTQRGNIDCGGADYIIVRYGSFYEFMTPTRNGHVSVGMELEADLLKNVEAILDLLKQRS